MNLSCSKPIDGKRWAPQEGRHAQSFLTDLQTIQKDFQITLKNGRTIVLIDGLSKAIRLMTDAGKAGKKLIFIGNGGSAAIASHQAVDYWKNGGMESIAFNDASLLTCIGNDCGYENVFAFPMKRFAKRGDVLIAISSSGKSPNILNGVTAAVSSGCQVLTFSGFSSANPLRKMGQINFYVPSHSYGIVEVSHLAIIHSMLREIIHINPHALKNGY